MAGHGTRHGTEHERDMRKGLGQHGKDLTRQSASLVDSTGGQHKRGQHKTGRDKAQDKCSIVSF